MDNANGQSPTKYTQFDDAQSSERDRMSVSSPRSTHSTQSFFNSSDSEPEQSQASDPQPMSLDRDSAILLLLSAVLQELKRHNDIELFKLKLEEEKKQAEIERAEQEQIEDDERFNSIRDSLYS